MWLFTVLYRSDDILASNIYITRGHFIAAGLWCPAGAPRPAGAALPRGLLLFLPGGRPRRRLHALRRRRAHLPGWGPPGTPRPHSSLSGTPPCTGTAYDWCTSQDGVLQVRRGCTLPPVWYPWCNNGLHAADVPPATATHSPARMGSSRYRRCTRSTHGLTCDQWMPGLTETRKNRKK